MTDDANGNPALRSWRFAYCDPPAGELSRELVDALTVKFPDGWALALPPRQLGWILPGCPSGCRVLAWVMLRSPADPAGGMQGQWDAVIVRGGRPHASPAPRAPRDWACSTITSGGPGVPRRPGDFIFWVLRTLNVRSDDAVVDIFPDGKVSTDTIDDFLHSAPVYREPVDG
jgi:hypothetical protein